MKKYHEPILILLATIALLIGGALLLIFNSTPCNPISSACELRQTLQSLGFIFMIFGVVGAIILHGGK